MLADTALNLALLKHIPWAVFVFCLGASVGSFMNVVIYRLPLGMSLSMPPSRCPICGGRLRFFRENLPILGWLILRGSCRYCRQPIPIRYMLVELGMAIGFLGLYVVLFWGDTWAVGGDWWQVQQFAKGWPAYVAVAFCFAGLVGMTVIDAKTFMIPIQIPLFVTLAAFLLWPVQAVLASPWPRVETWPIPGVSWWWFSVAACGVIGVVIARVLLSMGVLKWSFADYEEYVQEDEPLAEYPHARREMVVELLYLLPVMLCVIIGGVIGTMLPSGGPPVFLQAIGASFLGYLAGAGLVWAVRILGTFAFGREAMGLGDVHLLGAVGAVFGWFDPILIFFIAPFIGLCWVLLTSLISAVSSHGRRELPYGPHLALATLLLFLCRPVVLDAWSTLVPTVPMPQRALVEPESIFLAD